MWNPNPIEFRFSFYASSSSIPSSCVLLKASSSSIPSSVKSSEFDSEFEFDSASLPFIVCTILYYHYLCRVHASFLLLYFLLVVCMSSFCYTLVSESGANPRHDQFWPPPNIEKFIFNNTCLNQYTSIIKWQFIPPICKNE